MVGLWDSGMIGWWAGRVVGTEPMYSSQGAHNYQVMGERRGMTDSGGPTAFQAFHGLSTASPQRNINKNLPVVPVVGCKSIPALEKEMGQEGDYPWGPCEGGSACGFFQHLPAPSIPAPSQGSPGPVPVWGSISCCLSWMRPCPCGVMGWAGSHQHQGDPNSRGAKFLVGPTRLQHSPLPLINDSLPEPSSLWNRAFPLAQLELKT